MKLDNGILHLELTNEGGEMSSLTYKGYDVLYKGDGPYWKGKNPTLFPMISSPNAKQYTYDGVTYPCRNHGLIRYATLETTVETDEQITMTLKSSEETLKEYPFEFEYNITYKLDNYRVLISYDITNKSNKVMPFTFGLHPGFVVRDFNKMKLIFPDDNTASLFNQKDRTDKEVNVNPYLNFIDDLKQLDTVIFKNLNSKYVTLAQPEYDVNVDMSNFKYLALWTADVNSNYMCIEPWLSINNIKPSDNPFDPNFELEYLKPNETYNIDYYIEVK